MLEDIYFSETNSCNFSSNCLDAKDKKLSACDYKKLFPNYVKY